MKPKKSKIEFIPDPLDITEETMIWNIAEPINPDSGDTAPFLITEIMPSFPVSIALNNN